MVKGFQFYQLIMNGLFKTLLAYGAIVIGLDVIAIFAESVGRYIFGSSRAFMEEYPRLLTPYFVFPLMGAIFRLKKHIGVEILPEKLTGHKRSWLKMIICCIVIAIAAEFLIAGASSVRYYREMGYETQTEFALPLWWVYLSFPVGFAVLILFAIEMLWEALLNLMGLRQIKTDQTAAEGKA